MKRLLGILLGLIVLTGIVSPAYAKASLPDQAYTYDSENTAVPAPNSFQVKTIISEVTLGCDVFSDPQDLFVDSEDQMYILDSGKCRVLWINENYELVKIIDTFSWNGEPLTLAKGAQGLFYQETTGNLYISDTNNNRIIVCDRTGEVSRIYEKPITDLLEEGVEYKPAKIIVDNMEIMYVISQNVNTGALLIDSDNTFLGFYGVNSIKNTLEVQIEFMWRSIMTEEQIRQSQVSFQPTGFNNLYWTKDRFVYAVSPVSDTIESPVVKLNALGKNVLQGDTFGDLADTSITQNPIFIDITADDEGAFTVLDSSTGKLYQYDNSCNLLSVFGGLGSQKGLFTLPIAIESNSKNEILILDSKKNTVTVMEQTYYGEMIRDALSLYNAGRYEEALEPWLEVLRMNANYNTAYIGIGKAYMNMKEYEQAMYYFELVEDTENYAMAKSRLRGEKLQEHFAVIAGAVILVMLIILGYDGIKKNVAAFYQQIKQRQKGERS
ncbi:MAG: hypothetical protein J6B85_03945 [Lachnospiraceae bacterium]|nr:hypothetical protein [Lachnospiraceae bacterium]